jgi:hypothetical protein
LALAGGAYGILVTLFITIYGTPRISAFGFIHHVDNWCGRCKLKWTSGTPTKDNAPIHNTHSFKQDGGDQHSTHSSLDHLTEHAGTVRSPLEESHPGGKRYSVSGLQPVVSNATLEDRIDYLEGILREYFVNVDYLDGLRQRRTVGKDTPPPLDQASPSPQHQQQQHNTVDYDYSIALRNI